MPTLKILKYPHPILKKRSKEIADLKDQTIAQLIPLMVKTMLEAGGVGLAAPQIGYNIRLIIVNTKEGVRPFINPVIVKKSLWREWGEEGCLSVSGVFGVVKRHRKVEIQFFDQYGKRFALKTSGLMARIFQHEIDHLDGVLFIDKAKNVKNTSVYAEKI